MLKVENLHFNYGPRKVLDGLNFEVQKGKLVGFLGPNGAGKTTTMNLISGFHYVTEGEILINGHSMSRYPQIAKKHIGFLPENAPLYGDMIVEDYLRFVCEIKGVTTDKLNQFVKEAIFKTGLQEVQQRLISRLSKGFRQRVGLAQALVHKPDLIILDEPTVGFDPQQVFEFKKLLMSLKNEHTVLWSTHILADVEDTCDEVIVIREGRIITQGSPQWIQANHLGPKELILTVKQPSPEFYAKLQSLDGVEQVRFIAEKARYHIFYKNEAMTDKVLEIAALEKVGVVQVDSDRRNLETLFLELTK
ncbi:ABC transporter ATP-binding protein [bacterium]|nr:ABC transporter ATP-binding protein [bacterium]